MTAYYACTAVEAQSRRLRWLCIAAGLGMMVLYGVTPFILAYIPLHILLDNSLIRHAAWREAHGPATIRSLRLLQVHHAVFMLVFGSLAVILAMQDDLVMHWGAGLLLIAHAMNCIAMHSKSRDRAVIAVPGMIVFAQIVALVLLADSGATPGQRLFVHLCIGIVSVYFGFVSLTATSLHRDLEARTRQLVAAQQGETVGRLTSGIAHDFNNLLTVMRGNLDLLEEVPEEEKVRLREEIAAAMDRGGDLVAQLMDRSRPSGNTRVALDLEDFLQAFAKFARRVLPANIAMDLTSEHGISLLTDPAQLEAALLNLIANSRDAMQTGGKITVTSMLQQQDGAPFVVVEVADNGPGMLPEVLVRASDAYVTTKAPGNGTGLGLAMVRTFAESQGGHIEIESTPSTGTTVRIWLPL